MINFSRIQRRENLIEHLWVYFPIRQYSESPENWPYCLKEEKFEASQVGGEGSHCSMVLLPSGKPLDNWLFVSELLLSPYSACSFEFEQAEVGHRNGDDGCRRCSSTSANNTEFGIFLLLSILPTMAFVIVFVEDKDDVHCVCVEENRDGLTGNEWTDELQMFQLPRESPQDCLTSD